MIVTMLSDDDDAKTSYKKLSESEWAEAKALFELGKLNKVELAAKFGVTRQSIGDGLAKRGAVYGKRSGVIEESTVDSQKGRAQARLEEITTMKERQRQRIELIQALTIKQITEMAKAGTPISLRRADIAALRSAMAIIASGRSELYQIYDLVRDPDGAEEIPEFIVGEYTSDEIDALNRTRLGVSEDDMEEVSTSLSGGATDPSDDPLADLLSED